MEKDSTSLGTTNFSFFCRSAHFGNVSPFLVGATNTFSDLIHLLVELPNCVLKQQSHILQFIRSAWHFRLFPSSRSRQALLLYSHFHSFLILHYIYYISQRSNAKKCFRITGLQRQDSKPSADNNTQYSPSKSITECINFIKRAGL